MASQWIWWVFGWKPKSLGGETDQSRGKQAAGAGGCAVTESCVPCCGLASVLTDDGLDSQEHLSKETKSHAECQVFYNDFGQLTLKEIGLITTHFHTGKREQSK